MSGARYKSERFKVDTDPSFVASKEYYSHKNCYHSISLKDKTDKMAQNTSGTVCSALCYMSGISKLIITYTCYNNVERNCDFYLTIAVTS